MKTNIITSLVLSTLFFALPAAAVVGENTPPRSEQIVTIESEQEASFQLRERSLPEAEAQPSPERGRSRLEQRFSQPEKRDSLEQSLLIRKF